MKRKAKANKCLKAFRRKQAASPNVITFDEVLTEDRYVCGRRRRQAAIGRH